MGRPVVVVLKGWDNIPESPGVYGIYSAVNNKIYVGSSIHMRKRTASHRTDLANNKHNNPYLQNAYNCYGAHEFEIIVLEYSNSTDKMVLFDLEQKWLDYCRDNYAGVYNNRPIAESTRGIQFTDEQKAARSVRSKEFMSRPENKEKYSTLMAERMQDLVFREKAAKARSKEWNVTIYDPEGNPHFIERDLNSFCREYSLLPSNLAKVLAGTQAHHRGWRVNPDFDYKTNHGSAVTYDVIVIDPNDNIYGPITNVQKFCFEHDINKSGISSFIRMLQGKQKQHKGWKLVQN